MGHVPSQLAVWMPACFNSMGKACPCELDSVPVFSFPSIGIHLDFAEKIPPNPSKVFMIQQRSNFSFSSPTP